MRRLVSEFSASSFDGSGTHGAVSGGTDRAPEHARTVYPGARVLVMFPIYNEGTKLEAWVDRLSLPIADKVLAVNDGSTDEGPAVLRSHGIEVLDQSARGGIGTCIRRAAGYARDHGYDVMVVMAGNGKDDPAEVPRLVEALLSGADYVQGSRFLPGGASPHLPAFRRLSIRLLSLLFTLYARRRCTDLTNGFRAYRLSLLDDPRINIDQRWLDTYELEYYIHWMAYMLGYRVAEVPVTKRYPEDPGVEYTKIRPIVGWWSMLRPFVLLGLRIRK